MKQFNYTMIYPYKEETEIKYEVGTALVLLNLGVNMSKLCNIWTFKLQ